MTAAQGIRKRFGSIGSGAFLIATAALASPATGQELLVRAIGQPPERALVTQLAKSASPRLISEAEHPDYAALTYAAIASRECGSLHDGYLDALAILNAGIVIDPSATAGPAAFTMKWPACFEVRQNVSYTVRKGNHPTSIRLDLTGEYADGPELEPYFSLTGINPRKAILQPGQILTFPFRTLKTRVEVPSEAVATFIKDLKTIGGRRVQVEAPRSRGTLIGPARSGTTLAADDDCTYETDDRYPFSALEVANAYQWLEEAQNTVYVAVVDNGFFGVPCGASACPSRLTSESDYSPRFPKGFFAKPGFYRYYGANLGVQHILGPINYPDLGSADVNDVSGHGTHVAGLVLGGPTFETHRHLIVDRASKAARIVLSIVAVARGTLELDSQTESRITAAIDAMVSPMLVNLSIAFDEPETEPIFRNLVKNDKILFIAAAGNKGARLDEDSIYPAALGGRSQPNLVTVASIDSTGELSSFSNYGPTVDIAAPGCKIVSWLNSEGPDVPISGTSQAAPLVTFASALILSKMAAGTPRSIKNRLIYSGDLIRSAQSRARVWSGTQLSIPKALFLHDDFVAFRSNGSTVAYLGKIERFGGVTCGTKERSYDELRSLKRVSGEEIWVYTETTAGPVSVCAGRLAQRTSADPATNIMLSFRPRARLQGASIVRVDPAAGLLTFSTSQLVELVRGMPDE